MWFGDTNTRAIKDKENLCSFCLLMDLSPDILNNMRHEQPIELRLEFDN